jgi:hypothetical protein
MADLPWLPADRVQRMRAELAQYGEATRSELTERIIEDAAPLAAYTVAKLMTDETVEPRIRLDAAKYFIDRQLGKANTRVLVDTTPDNPVNRILDGAVILDSSVPSPDHTGSEEVTGTVLDRFGSSESGFPAE